MGNQENPHSGPAEQRDPGAGASRRWRVYLYLLNFALLFTHQIDSAYWQEWRLFHLPGGLAGFLWSNLILLLLALAGFAAVITGHRFGRAMALVLAGGGLFAFTIHTYFLLAGRPEFAAPTSIVILWSTLLVSLAQGWLELRGCGVRSSPGGGGTKLELRRPRPPAPE